MEKPIDFNLEMVLAEIVLTFCGKSPPQEIYLKSWNSEKKTGNKSKAKGRQGPRFSIRMVNGIFCSDTETGAETPPGVMQKK